MTEQDTKEKHTETHPESPTESPTNHHGHHPSLASTAHAVRVTQGWKPARLERRPSWTPEDRKRDLQMGVMKGGLPEGWSQVSEGG